MIELMIVLAILGILAALAAPSFSDSIRRFRVNAVRDDMTSSIYLAKSEAIRRRLSIGLVRTAACGVLPTAGDWDCGWDVFVDTNGDGLFTAGDLVLQSFTVPNGFRLTNTAVPANPVMIINRFGQPAVANQRFVVSPPEGPTGAATITVCFNAGGRVRALRGDIAC